MASTCEKTRALSTSYHSQLSSCLPHEFLKERPFEKKVSRRMSDPLATKVQEILYDKIPAPSEVDYKEFIPHMKALQRIQDEMQAFLCDKAEEIPIGQEIIFHGIFIQIPFEEAKREKIALINKISLIYNTWKRSVTEFGKTTSSENTKQECLQLENEINKALKLIAKSLEDLDGCYDFEKFQKHYQKFHDSFISLDQTINELKHDIELEHINFDKAVLCAFFSANARLCNLLGLELDALREIDEEKEILSYYSLQSFVLMSLENSFRYLEDENKFELSVEALQNLGFAKHVAQILVDFIPTDIREHLSTLDWVKLYIQNQFKYNIFLALEYPDRFPFRKELTRKWFTLKEKPENATSECNITNVSMINLESREDTSYTAQYEKVFPDSLKDEQYIVLYHGTDHLSARDILFDGIDLRKGRENCDFSHKFGFYLTNDLDKAVNWSFNRPKAKPAVLVYRVEIASLRNRRFLDLSNDYSIDDLDWKKVAVHNIRGATDKKLRKKLKPYDFIEGPISTVPRPVDQNRYKHPSPEPNTYQICLNSEDFAQEFDQYIHSILFYDK